MTLKKAQNPPAEESTTLSQWMKELGPWDHDKLFALPMIREERLVKLIDLISRSQIGTAKIVGLSKPYEDKEYVDARIEYSTRTPTE